MAFVDIIGFNLLGLALLSLHVSSETQKLQFIFCPSINYIFNGFRSLLLFSFKIHDSYCFLVSVYFKTGL